MHQLLLGLSLGLGSGLAPGPLLALVIRSSLERGFAAGARVAVSPLLTDVSVIAVAVVLAAWLPMAVLGALGIGGGAFVLWLGVKALREQTPPAEAAADAASPHADLRRGALTNLLSPPIRAIGHYDLHDGQLRRTPGLPDQLSPSSAALYGALHPPAGAGPASHQVPALSAG